MQALRELQQAFGAYVQDALSPSIAHHFRTTVFAPEDILAIHRNTFRVTLTEALAANFPAILNLIGEACFGAHAERFIKCHPPNSPVLSTYGAAFPEFLAGQTALATVPYLGDVGRLEWAWNEAFHALDAPTLTPVELRQQASQCSNDFTLTLHPSARLLSSPFPIAAIWRMARDTDGQEQKIDFSAGVEHLLLLRPVRQVSVLSIDTGTYALLGALNDGEPLNLAVEAALQAAPEFSLEGSLGNLLVRGTFASHIPQPKD